MSAPANSPSNSAPPEMVADSLYEIRKKIYPRSVTGTFATWRWIAVWVTQLVFYGLCWLPWSGRQAVLFELTERKFYIFGLVFWPQDVFFLSILLIISAYGLFLFTAIGGRLWCGYACPQTVYTQMFLWIEKLFEGDRNARMKLDQSSWTSGKVLRKGGKFGAWLLLSLWTGFTFVGYFTPIKTLWAEAASFSFGPWEIFWTLFYGAFTFLMAGHLREQVCKYMCPYARFQGVMFDPDTLVITYDEERGEPRGTRSKKVDIKAEGLGHCVDCNLCVAVCPTGIDIRKGLQYECIGCAACIDACDQVMDKMAYPRGLIRYTTERAIERHWGWREIVGHIARPRILIYSGILASVVVAFVWGIATKPVLRVDVLRDRATLAREVEDGLIENVYRLHVMNVSESAQHYVVTVEGLDDIRMVGPAELDVPAAATVPVTMSVRVPSGTGKKGSNVIYVNVRSTTDGKIAVREPTTFIQL